MVGQTLRNQIGRLMNHTAMSFYGLVLSEQNGETSRLMRKRMKSAKRLIFGEVEALL
jgi:hypothetical protein